MLNIVYIRRMLVLALLPLTGCVSGSGLTERLTPLQGRPVEEALRVLGSAATQQKAGSQLVYSWVHYEAGSYSAPATGLTPVIGNVGGQPAVTYTRTDFPYREETYAWSCHLSLVTEKGIIVHAQAEAVGGGCRRFEDKLEPLLKKSP